MSDFSFDDWAKLYKTSPEDFERKRKEAIEAEILKAPIERRNKLRLLQMEIDATRADKNPLAATVAISVMMQNKVGELKEAYSSLESPLNDLKRQAKELE